MQTQTLEVHPTLAKQIPVGKLNQLNYIFKTAVGLSVTNELDETPALDVDSKPFGVDPMASATISNDKMEFTDLRPLSKTYLAGVGGKVPVEAIGTLHWTIEDDQGLTHRINIKDSYYCSQAPMRLLCPQQWAAQREKELGKEHSVSFVTKALYSRLNWSEFTLTIPHDDKTNLPLWRTAPSYHKVAMSATTPLLPAPAIVTDDEDSDSDESAAEATGRNKPQELTFPFEKNVNEQQVV